MSKELLDQVMFFEQNRDNYNEEERKAIRRSFKDILKKKCNKFQDTFIRSIDDINRL